MKKVIAIVLAVLFFVQAPLSVSAATVISKDKAPDFDIWMANSLINGLNGSEGVYKSFRGFQDPVYRILGNELLKDKPLVSMSTAWTIFFNSEYRNQFANEQKYIYEIILMNYLKSGTSVEVSGKDLVGNEFKFAKSLYGELVKELNNNTIEYIHNKLSLEKAEKIWRNAKIAEGIGIALDELNDGKKTIKKLVEEVSQYLALQEVKENKIKLLKASREAAGSNLDYKRAVDDIVKVLDATDLNYIQNRSLEYLWNQTLDTAWGKLTKANPVLAVIELGVSGLDMCFDTSNSASNNLKLALLYTVDCYMSTGMMNSTQVYLSNKSAGNAKKFRECFEGYVQFQMFGNEFAKKWLGQYFSGGSIKDLFNQIFNQANIRTAKELENLAQSQINTRKSLLRVIEKHTDIYKSKYPISKKESSNSVGIVQISKVDTSKQNKMLVEWKRVAGANGYQIYTSESKAGKYTKAATTKADKTNYTLKVANGKTIYIKIRAFRNTNSAKSYGAFSSIRSGTEIGATWYRKILKMKSKNYTVRDQITSGVRKATVNIKDYPCYAVKDLDKDGIKELILHTGRDDPYYENRILLMTYKNNKEQPLLSFGGAGGRGHFYLTGKNIAMITSGSKEFYGVYFTVRDGKLVKVRDMEKWTEIDYTRHYLLNGKEVSEYKFRQEFAKYFPPTLQDMTFKKIER